MTDKDKLSREDLRAERAAPPRRGTFHRILVLVAVLAVVLGAVLPLLCLIVLPVWLIVTKAPELVVHAPAPEAAEPAGKRA